MWDIFLFLDQVYGELKEKYENLPIFLTFQLETYIDNKASQEEAMEKLIPYTDYIGISSYPFGKYPVPEDIPIDWFSYLSHLAPQKPIAVTETSYLAQDTCFDVFDNTIQGDEEGQYEYLLSLLESLDDIDAEFLIWFAIRDYDQLWERMEDAGVDEIFKSWRDTGLIGENGRPHKALYLWDQWLALPVSQ